jgi:hypothetical protein
MTKENGRHFGHPLTRMDIGVVQKPSYVSIYIKSFIDRGVYPHKGRENSLSPTVLLSLTLCGFPKQIDTWDSFVLPAPRIQHPCGFAANKILSEVPSIFFSYWTVLPRQGTIQL